MIIAIDPGDKRNGIAMFNYDKEKRKADLRAKAIVTLNEMYDLFAMAEAIVQKSGESHIFVVENFRVDTEVRGVMFQWNEMLTSQVIGAVKYAAFRMNKSPVVIQEPKILVQGRIWCDFKVPKKGHIADDISAYIHGVHYMIRTNMINSVNDVLKYGQEKID